MASCTDIRNFGGRGDGFTVSARVVQSAIDARSWARGVTVQLDMDLDRVPSQADRL